MEMQIVGFACGPVLAHGNIKSSRGSGRCIGHFSILCCFSTCHIIGLTICALVMTIFLARAVLGLPSSHIGHFSVFQLPHYWTQRLSPHCAEVHTWQKWSFTIVLEICSHKAIFKAILGHFDTFVDWEVVQHVCPFHPSSCCNSHTLFELFHGLHVQQSMSTACHRSIQMNQCYLLQHELFTL